MSRVSEVVSGLTLAALLLLCLTVAVILHLLSDSLLIAGAGLLATYTLTLVLHRNLTVRLEKP